MPPALRSPVASMPRSPRPRDAAAADVDQRADDDAHHVLEEGGRLDVERQHAAPAARRPGGARSGSSCCGRSRTRGTRGSRARPPARRRRAGRRRCRPPGARATRCAPAAASGRSGSRPCSGRPCRAPRSARRSRAPPRPTSTIARSAGRIEFSPRSRPCGGMVSSEIEAGDLAVGVHARVGAAGAAHEHRLAGHVADGVFERRLDGPLPYLPLPAREVGAVVLDDDAPPCGSKLEHDARATSWCRRGACRFDMPRPGDVGVA